MCILKTFSSSETHDAEQCKVHAPVMILLLGHFLNNSTMVSGVTKPKDKVFAFVTLA